MTSKPCVVCGEAMHPPEPLNRQSGNFRKRIYCSKKCRMRGWGPKAELWRKQDSKENPLKYRSARSRHHLKRYYGITAEQYIELHVAQNGVCAICAQRETVLRKGQVEGVLSVDHCHETGLIRGLLCNNCNRALGLFKDNPELLHKAADYVSLKAMHHGK